VRARKNAKVSGSVRFEAGAAWQLGWDYLIECSVSLLLLTGFRIAFWIPIELVLAFLTAKDISLALNKNCSQAPFVRPSVNRKQRLASSDCHSFLTSKEIPLGLDGPSIRLFRTVDARNKD